MMLTCVHNMSAWCSPSQMSTLVSFLALANLIFIPCLLLSPGGASLLPAPIRPHQNHAQEFLCGCSPRCQMELEFIQKGREALSPQHGATLWQSATKGFHNCGRGLLKYLNNSVNLGFYVAFTIGSSKSAQMTILISFILLSFLPVTLPEENIFSHLSVIKYMYRDQQM